MTPWDTREGQKARQAIRAVGRWLTTLADRRDRARQWLQRRGWRVEYLPDVRCYVGNRWNAEEGRWLCVAHGRTRSTDYDRSLVLTILEVVKRPTEDHQ